MIISFLFLGHLSITSSKVSSSAIEEIQSTFSRLSANQPSWIHPNSISPFFPPNNATLICTFSVKYSFFIVFLLSLGFVFFLNLLFAVLPRHPPPS